MKLYTVSMKNVYTDIPITFLKQTSRERLHYLKTNTLLYTWCKKRCTIFIKTNKAKTFYISVITFCSGVALLSTFM